MEIKQYKDYDGKSVKIGDVIEKTDILGTQKPLGKVLSLRKEGFYVWVKTENYPNSEIWGKFTRKVD